MIDLNKTYRTRNGYEVSLWTTTAKYSDVYVVHGEIRINGIWRKKYWTIDGNIVSGHEDAWDLVEYSPPKLRPYNDDELWELKGRWIRHKSSPDSGDMVTGIHRDLVIAGGMRYYVEVLTDFVFCKGDPEEGKPVAKEG